MFRLGYELQGRLLTAATIGLLIGGGAYASTVDEATFWYMTVLFAFLWFFSGCNLSLYSSQFAIDQVEFPVICVNLLRVDFCYLD